MIKNKFFLALLIATIAFIQTVQAASSGSCGATAEACSYTLDDDGNLTVYGNGKMNDYPDWGGSPWGTGVKTITISGITKIGSHAFNASLARSIDIPNSVTEIGSFAFESSSRLTKVTLPDSLSRLDMGAFSSTLVSTLVLPDSLFNSNARFSNIALSGSHVTNLICSDNNQSACSTYLTTAERIYHDDQTNQWLTAPLDNRDNIAVSSYTLDGDRYVKNGTRYQSFEDMQKGKPVKRIYTIDEANQVAGEKNTVTIRYK